MLLYTRFIFFYGSAFKLFGSESEYDYKRTIIHVENPSII